MSDTELHEQVTFRETKRVLEIVDRVVTNRGWNGRATLIREAIRTWLANGSHLTEQEKKDLGVNGKAKNESA